MGDAADGDATLFAREDGVEAAWAVVDGVLNEPGEPLLYGKGTWGPAESGMLANDSGGWHDPAAHEPD